MPKRVQKESSPSERKEEVVEELPTTAEADEAKKKATEELLDEIDEVLEENAEEFVKSYIQKGGE